MFPRKCRLIKIDLKILLTVLLDQLILNYLMIHFELNWQKVA